MVQSEARECSPQGACVKCGTVSSLEARAFDKTYTPRWVWFGLPFGLIPVAFLMLLGQKKYRLLAPFCRPCWNRFRIAGPVSALSLVATIVLLIVSFFGALTFGSWWLLLVGLGIGVVVASVAGAYDKRVSPRYARLNREVAEIYVPGIGATRVMERSQ